MKDAIYREDAIKAINFRARIPHDIASAQYASMAINAICSVPSADRPSEVIYGNEHNCIMTIFGECSYAETGCGDCAVVEKVRKALSADKPQKWIPCSERLPRTSADVLTYRPNMGMTMLVDSYDRYYGEDDNEYYEGWAYGGDSVVAWMPLPEPWKGADE